VTNALSVSGPRTVAPIKIPAPVYAGLTLAGGLPGASAGDAGSAGTNPIVNALVRVFRMPAQQTAMEVGRAVTDANSHFDMYLDPHHQ
jgi:hypothetical protein